MKNMGDWFSKNIRAFLPALVHRCLSCGFLSQETARSPLYHCGVCQSQFNRVMSCGRNNQCPHCMSFGRRIAPDSCPNCNAGEMLLEAAFRCPVCRHVFQPKSELQLSTCPNCGFSH